MDSILDSSFRLSKFDSLHLNVTVFVIQWNRGHLNFASRYSIPIKRKRRFVEILHFDLVELNVSGRREATPSGLYVSPKALTVGVFVFVGIFQFLVGGETQGGQHDMIAEEKAHERKGNETINKYKGSCRIYDACFPKGSPACVGRILRQHDDLGQQRGHGEECSHRNHGDVQQEVLVVPSSHAVSRPGTMVIESIHAVVAHPAMHRTRRPLDLTRRTELGFDHHAVDVDALGGT